MRRLLIGIFAAVILVGSGAYFGWDLWAQFRTRSEVEKVFDSLRTVFPAASHGKIELFPRTRSLRISNIVLQSQDRATTIKIGQIIAVGTKGPLAGRVSAGRIEIANWEFSTAIPAAPAAALSYKAPSIVIEAFSGPADLPLKAGSSSMLEIMRASLEYAAASAANSVKIPKLIASVSPQPSAAADAAIPPVEYNYSDIAFRTIRDRRIAAITIDRATVTGDGGARDIGSFAGAMAGMSLADLDLGAITALFDPGRVKDGGYLQIYRQATIGLFEVRTTQGASFQIDGITVDDIGILPSKFSIAGIVELTENAPRPGTPPTEQQLHDLTERFAQLYEGVRIGKFEMRGLRVRVPPDVGFSMAVMRIAGLENGRLAEFAVEGINGRSPKNEPISIGRFAFAGLHMSSLIRQASALAEGGANPKPDQVARLLSVLEGIEVEGLTVTPEGRRQAVRIDTFRLTWGQFVGAVPSAIRLTAKTTVPTDIADMGVGGVLSDSGFATVTTRIDLGLTWTEATQVLALAPVLLEVENAFSFSADIAVRNVPRTVFAADPIAALNALEHCEAGPVRLTLRDTGAVRTALAQYAKSRSVSVDEARKEIIASVHALAKTSPPNAGAEALARAVADFLETPGSTLTIAIIPKENVKFGQLVEKSGDPAAIGSLFSVEAKAAQ